MKVKYNNLDFRPENYDLHNIDRMAMEFVEKN